MSKSFTESDRYLVNEFLISLNKSVGVEGLFGPTATGGTIVVSDPLKVLLDRAGILRNGRLDRNACLKWAQESVALSTH